MVSDASSQRESVMGQLSFAVGKPAVAVSYGQNVVPFNTRRHTARARLYPAAQPRLPEAVVVRLPKAPRTDETIGKRRAKSSGSEDNRAAKSEMSLYKTQQRT
jgi:hypothetical protein